MLLSTFTGNNGIKESLLGALASGRLSHGLLLCGEKGMGVNYFALLLAADIIGSTDIDGITAGKSPLVQIVRGEGASGLIRVDKIRQINENVSYSSINGEKRVIIIENCENFNQNSANALLKNLEEPKDDITYILTTTNARSILATIRSRCAVYTLTAPTRRQTLDYFCSQGSDIQAVESLMAVYGENIGKISSALNSEKRYAVLQDAVTLFDYISKEDTYQAARLCYGYNKRKDDLKMMMDDLRDICHRNLSEKSIQAINTVQKYTEILQMNVNLNLMIENFAVEITK
ncbi:MAG: AAA family ATPase [Oscillospiraceae bacterium]|nr:AAA family ATPase [Oscillospiraceae bacterium]